MSLDQFRCVAVLGRGHFGKVCSACFVFLHSQLYFAYISWGLVIVSTSVLGKKYVVTVLKNLVGHSC